MSRLISSVGRTLAVILALLGGVLAVRSRAHTDVVAALVRGRVQYAALHDGRIGIWLSQYRATDQGTWRTIVDTTTPCIHEIRQALVDQSPPRRVYKWRGMGVSWGFLDPRKATPFWSIEIPDWALTVPTLVIGARWYLRALRRSSRREGGCCVACGYDLRGNPQAERCAECGVRVEVVVQMRAALHASAPSEA